MTTAIAGAGQHAFGSTCPGIEYVLRISKELGFSLEFHLDQITSPVARAYPAQYHFSTREGTELIVLMGKDRDPDGRHLPPHACRVWLYPGNSSEQTTHVALTLADLWGLTWQPSQLSKQVA